MVKLVHHGALPFSAGWFLLLYSNDTEEVTQVPRQNSGSAPHCSNSLKQIF